MVITAGPAKLQVPSLPLTASVIDFVGDLLPPATDRGHLPLIYHQPRHPPPYIRRIVLSVTATPGVYAALHESRPSLLFLHRPWQLDRRRLTPSTWVIASHQRLDELLTTGHNEPLMRRLIKGADESQAQCSGQESKAMASIVGYKQDPTRKMGLVARVPSWPMSDWLRLIQDEFGTLEATHPKQDVLLEMVPLYLACMNAFEPAIIDRVVEAANALASASTRDEAAATIDKSDNDPEAKSYDCSSIDPSRILYLTGQSRPPGIEHAEKLGGMPVVCVGHRACEVWAIRYLAQRLRETFEGLETVVVDEPEETVQHRARSTKES